MIYTHWCSICNARPADGVLTLVAKSTDEYQDYDVCDSCVEDVVSGKIDWIENKIN